MLFFLSILLIQASEVDNDGSESSFLMVGEVPPTNSDISDHESLEVFSESHMSATEIQASVNGDSAASEAFQEANPTSDIQNEPESRAQLTHIVQLEQRNRHLEQLVRDLENRFIEQENRQRTENEEGNDEATAQSHEVEVATPSTPEEQNGSDAEDTSRDEEFARELQQQYDNENEVQENPHEAGEATVQRLAAAEDTSRDEEIARALESQQQEYEQVIAVVHEYPCEPIEQQIADCVIQEAEVCQIKICQKVEFLASETGRIATTEVIPFVEHNACEVARIAKDDVVPFLKDAGDEVAKFLRKPRFW